VALKVCCSRGLGKRSIQLALLAIVVGITCLLAASGENGVLSRFMLKPERIIVERRPDPAYDRLFPYYVELCATSQFRSKLRGGEGSRVMRSSTSKGLARMSGHRFRNYDGATQQRLRSTTRSTALV
jgi:hypothetical protein